MKYIFYYLYRIHLQVKQRNVIIVLYIWRNTLISKTGYGMGELVNQVIRTIWIAKSLESFMSIYLYVLIRINPG